MNINWFPGHMAKAKREIKENLKLVDVIIEIVDARIPRSSRNPEFEELVGDKLRVIVLNKSDLADEKSNSRWINYFKSQGMECVLLNSLKGDGINTLLKTVNKIMEDKLKEIITFYGVTKQLKHFHSEVFELIEAILSEEDTGIINKKHKSNEILQKCI